MDSSDVIAVVAIVATVINAGITAALSYSTGWWQRKHERRMAYEERTWEKKAETLTGLMRVVLDLGNAAIETPPAGTEVTPLMVQVPVSLPTLVNLQPSVEIYASPATRQAVTALLAYLTINTEARDGLTASPNMSAPKVMHLTDDVIVAARDDMQGN